MPFFIDTVTNRVVVAPMTVEIQPSLKVIDGETSATCHLSDGQALTPAQVNALLDGSPSAFRATLSPNEKSTMDANRASEVSTTTRLFTRLRGVTYLGSHPRYASTVESLDLALDDSGLIMSLYDERWETIYWDQIHHFSSDNRESMERRITATRVLLLGALGLFVKKEQVVSYLVVGDRVGDWMFAVPGVSAMELRAWAQPATARVERDRPPMPPPTPTQDPRTLPSADLLTERLTRLDALRDRGAITAEEHADRRTAIINEL